MKLKTVLIIALSLVVIQTSFAQDKKKSKKITISGFVVDENDIPIQGVTIIVDGKTLNKQTNKKGFYKIKVKSENKTLMMYSLFHGGLEVDLKGQSKISFVLSSTLGSQEVATEELVDRRYERMLEEASTNSYGTKAIKNKELSSTNYTNIFDMIRSKFPNVTIINGGVVIRGIHSMKGAGKALFVVDGIPTSSLSVNPSDVKSISILKGAAAAIYGSRGSNGVVLITTIGAR